MKELHFGVDYYPEHWERSRWEKDAVLMQEMGIQMVRMAEFSWHKLQRMFLILAGWTKRLGFWDAMGYIRFWERLQRRRRHG